MWTNNDSFHLDKYPAHTHSLSRCSAALNLPHCDVVIVTCLRLVASIERSDFGVLRTCAVAQEADDADDNQEERAAQSEAQCDAVEFFVFVVVSMAAVARGVVGRECSKCCVVI